MKTQDKLKQTLIENLKLVHFKDTAALENILFAYDLAKAAHEGQFRDGGAPYITHPVEGSIMLARDYSIQNPNLYITFLLHDAGEDTPIFGDREVLPWNTFKETFLLRVGRIFGEAVAHTVLLLTKPPVNGTDFESKSDMMSYYLLNLEKVSLSRNFAVLGKMIDRLHNLRSLPPENTSKIQRQVVETEEFLIPLFERVIGNFADSEDTSLIEPDLKRKLELVLKDIKAQVEILKAK